MKLLPMPKLFDEITEIPEALNQANYPSLNGLRAVSIIMVVVAHLVSMYQIGPRSLEFIGGLGVNIFFVLSGFLITTLCIKEKVLTKTISLKNFYIRRALRILPVAYLFIVVLLILNRLLNLQISNVSFFTSTFFLADLSYFKVIHFDWNTSHYWSLSVEEQFYILFPFFLKKYFRLYMLAILFILFVIPVIIYFQLEFNVLNSGIPYAATRFLIKFQGICLGCLCSVMLFKGYFNWGKWRLPLTLFSLVVIFYLRFDLFVSTKSVFENLVISIFTGFIVVNSIVKSNDILFKFLNLKLMSTIGILSYSIYIWQQIFVSNDPKFPPSIFPWNLLLMIVIPYLSYNYYEKFFLKLKNRFATAKKKAE